MSGMDGTGKSSKSSILNDFVVENSKRDHSNEKDDFDKVVMAENLNQSQPLQYQQYSQQQQQQPQQLVLKKLVKQRSYGNKRPKSTSLSSNQSSKSNDSSDKHKVLDITSSKSKDVEQSISKQTAMLHLSGKEKDESDLNIFDSHLPIGDIMRCRSDHAMDIGLVNILRSSEAISFRNSILNVKTKDDLFGSLLTHSRYLSNIILPNLVPLPIEDNPNMESLECAKVYLDASDIGASEKPCLEANSSKIEELTRYGMEHLKGRMMLPSKMLSGAEIEACKWTFYLSSWSLIGSIAHFVIDKLFSSPCIMVTLNKSKSPPDRPSKITIKNVVSSLNVSGSSGTRDHGIKLPPLSHQMKIDVENEFAFDIVLVTNGKIECLTLTVMSHCTILVHANSDKPEKLDHRLSISYPELANIPAALAVSNSIDPALDGIYFHDGFKDGASFYIKSNDIGIVKTTSDGYNTPTWTFKKLRSLQSKKGHAYRGEKILCKWNPTGQDDEDVNEKGNGRRTSNDISSSSLIPPRNGWMLVSTNKQSNIAIEYLKTKADIQSRALSGSEHDKRNEIINPQKSSQNMLAINRVQSKIRDVFGGHTRLRPRKTQDESITTATSDDSKASESLNNSTSDNIEQDASDVGLPIQPGELNKNGNRSLASTKDLLLSGDQNMARISITLRNASPSPPFSAMTARSTPSDSDIQNYNSTNDIVRQSSGSGMLVPETTPILNKIKGNEISKLINTNDEEDEEDDDNRPLLQPGWNKCYDKRAPIPPRCAIDVDDDDNDSFQSWIQLHRWLEKAIRIHANESDDVMSINKISETENCRYHIRSIGRSADALKKQIPTQVCAHAIVLTPSQLTYLTSVGVSSVYISAKLMCNGRALPCIPQETPKINVQDVLMMGNNPDGNTALNAKKESLANRLFGTKRKESIVNDKGQTNANTQSNDIGASPSTQNVRKKSRTQVAGMPGEILPNFSTNSENFEPSGIDMESNDGSIDYSEERIDLEAEAASFTEGKLSGIMLWGSKGWIAWCESISALGRLPISTRIVFTLHGTVSSTFFTGPTKIAVGSVQVFDPLCCARSGNMKIRMWPLREFGQTHAKLYRNASQPSSFLTLQTFPSEIASQQQQQQGEKDSTQSPDKLISPKEEDQNGKVMEGVANVLNSRLSRPPRSGKDLRAIGRLCETGNEWIGQPRKDEEHITLLVRFPKYSRPVLATGSTSSPQEILSNISTIERHASFLASYIDVSMLSKKAIKKAVKGFDETTRIRHPYLKRESSNANDESPRITESHDNDSVTNAMSNDSQIGDYNESSTAKKQAKKPRRLKSKQRRSSRILKSRSTRDETDQLLPQEEFVAERESRRQVSLYHVQRAIREHEQDLMKSKDSTVDIVLSGASDRDKDAMDQISKRFKSIVPFSMKESTELVARGLEDASEALNSFLMDEITSSSHSSDNINVTGLSLIASILEDENGESTRSEFNEQPTVVTAKRLSTTLPPLPPLSISSSSSSSSAASIAQGVFKHHIAEKMNEIILKSDDQRSFAEYSALWECRNYLLSREDSRVAVLLSSLIVYYYNPDSISSSTASSSSMSYGGSSNSLTGSSAPMNITLASTGFMTNQTLVGVSLSVDPRKRIELRRLFAIWPPLEVKTIAQILENRFLDDIEIREYAVKSLASKSDSDIHSVLDRLIDGLKLEQCHDSLLARLLIWRSLCEGSSDMLGAHLIKLLHNHILHDDGYTNRYLFILDALLVICPVGRVVRWFKLFENNFSELDDILKQISGTAITASSVSKFGWRSSGNWRYGSDSDYDKGSNNDAVKPTIILSKTVPGNVPLSPPVAEGKHQLERSEDVHGKDDDLNNKEKSLAPQSSSSSSSFIMTPSRSSATMQIYKKCGIMKKKSRLGTWQPRWFAIQDNKRCLFYWSSQKEYETNPEKRKVVQFSGNITVDMVNDMVISLKCKDISDESSNNNNGNEEGLDIDSSTSSYRHSFIETPDKLMSAGKVKQIKMKGSMEYDLKCEDAEAAKEWASELKQLFHP